MANQLSDEILEFLLDNSESMISIINHDLKYENVNESFCRNFKKQKQDLIGKSPSDLWGDKTYREKIRQNIERSLKGEEVQYRSSFDISGTSGKFYEVTYKPFKSPKSRLSYAIVETKDISDEVRTTEKYREKEIKYHFLQNHLPFGIFSCTQEGMITEANNTFYDILERDPDKAENLRFSDFTRADYRFSEHIRSGREGETGTFGQLQMITGGGKEIFVRIHSHIRKDKTHGCIIEGALEDTTREVILERRLNQSHRLETLGTLAGGVAHDFNTILTTISGYSELTMQDVEKDSSVYDYMSKQRSAVRKAESIINQMLVFSKQLDQHIIHLEVDKVLDEAVEFIQSSVPDNIKMRKNFSDTVGLVHADPTQLFRVFLNIMTNAIQAMENEGGILDVCLADSYTDNIKYADITIADTGEGIDKGIIDRIFEPFFTTKEVDKGTGMGLAVSHGIISDIGGEINVESRVGKGSVFTLRIPLDDSVPAPGPDSSVYSKKIIFAHDNVNLSRTVSLALERLGYKVTLVSSAADITGVISSKLPDTDILFIGNKLAGKGLYDILAGKIKEAGRMRIIIIRQKDNNNDDDQRFLENEDFAMINEPVTLKDILNELI